MIIVTSGSAYLDIDAYAGCIAYAELLNLTGRPARAVSRAPLNLSISPSLRDGGKGLDCHVPQPDDEFVLVDVSDPRYLDRIVKIERVIEVIDHHPGFEAFWVERLAERADIRVIGAACTQVYERWVASGLLASISPSSATLLAAGILDNTLNFGALVTTEQDIQAYAALARLAGLSDDWPARYFMECQEALEGKLHVALLQDLKTMEQSDLLPRFFAQLCVWNAQVLLQRQRPRIALELGKFSDDWLLNIISIQERKSHLLMGSTLSTQKIMTLLDHPGHDAEMVLTPPILRKELVAKALAKAAG
ncbi:DHH family protein [Pseudomonas purpurea]|uniref:DHH family phosphoesterase n=1 Tax=Pseudomonas purpurea TaxID=3136737 RepID=UPI0032644820